MRLQAKHWQDLPQPPLFWALFSEEENTSGKVHTEYDNFLLCSNVFAVKRMMRAALAAENKGNRIPIKCCADNSISVGQIALVFFSLRATTDEGSIKLEE